MAHVKMHEAKTHFSKLIAQVEAGEEIVVQRGDKPVARIVPYVEPQPPLRGFGSMRGEIWIADDFDETPEGFEDYIA
jgi:prevent-host-death family protein